MKNITGIFAVLIFLLAGLEAGVVATRNQLNAVLGDDLNEGGKLVYVNSADNSPYIVDLAADPLVASKITFITPVFSPLLSPDGELVAFWTGNTSSGMIFVCKAEADAAPQQIGAGYDPHWWTDPSDNKLYLIYCTETGAMSWPTPGETKKIEINPSTGAAIGSAATLIANSFNGGISRSGRYICTAYKDVVIYDLQEDTMVSLNDSTQACNASISPSRNPDEENKMMMLTLGGEVDGTTYNVHEIFYILNTSDELEWYVSLPPSTVEWQHPEWSVHEGYATATCKKNGSYQVYLVDVASGKSLPLVDGNNAHPHLWLGAEPASVSDRAFTADGTERIQVVRDGNRLMLRNTADIWTLSDLYGRPVGQPGNAWNLSGTGPGMVFLKRLDGNPAIYPVLLP